MDTPITDYHLFKWGPLTRHIALVYFSMPHSVMHSTPRNVPLRGVSINYLRAIDSRRDKRYARIRIQNIPSLPRQIDRSIDPRRFLGAAARKTDLAFRISRFLSTLF